MISPSRVNPAMQLQKNKDGQENGGSRLNSASHGSLTLASAPSA